MIKFRRHRLERTIKKELPEGGMEEVRAAHHLGDLHFAVIDYDSELISRNIVFAPDDEIAKVNAGDSALWSERPIEELQSFPLWHAGAPVHTGRFFRSRNR